MHVGYYTYKEHVDIYMHIIMNLSQAQCHVSPISPVYMYWSLESRATQHNNFSIDLYINIGSAKQY